MNELWRALLRIESYSLLTSNIVFHLVIPGWDHAQTVDMVVPIDHPFAKILKDKLDDVSPFRMFCRVNLGCPQENPEKLMFDLDSFETDYVD